MPTPDEIDALPDYTDAQLLKLYRKGLSMGAAGQSRSIDGRMVTFPSLKDMMLLIDWLERKAIAEEDEDEDNGGVALVEFGSPRPLE